MEGVPIKKIVGRATSSSALFILPYFVTALTCTAKHASVEINLNWDRGKGQTKLLRGAFFLPVSIFFFNLESDIVVIYNYKYNWHMKRTYIWAKRLLWMPWKDRMLTFFIFVRNMNLKEKEWNIDVKSPNFPHFDLVISYVYLQCKVFSQTNDLTLRLRANEHNNSQHCCASNVGICCVRVVSSVQTG